MRGITLVPRILADDVMLLAYDDLDPAAAILVDSKVCGGLSAATAHHEGDDRHNNWCVRFHDGYQQTINFFIDLGAIV